MDHNGRKTKIILLIIALILVEFTVISVSTILYNRDFQSKSDIRNFYQSANRIDNKSDYDYLLETGAGRSIIQTTLNAVDPVTLPQVSSGKKFTEISATYQKYQPHIETYTVTTTDSKGKSHTETKTRIVWKWDTVGNETKVAQKINFFKYDYDTNLFAVKKYEQDIPVKDVVANSNDSSNVQDTGFRSRTIWSGVPEKFDTTFYADLIGGSLKPIQFPNQKRDEQIRLHKNQPIDKFLANELEANTPHPIIWTIITALIVIVIGVSGIALILNFDTF